MDISDTIPAQFMKNEAYAGILGRVSVRRYTAEPVSDAEMTAILHAAMSAPSGVNRQPWEFVVVDDADLLSELAAALPVGHPTMLTPLWTNGLGPKSTATASPPPPQTDPSALSAE